QEIRLIRIERAVFAAHEPDKPHRTLARICRVDCTVFFDRSVAGEVELEGFCTVAPGDGFLIE
ncbi:MAG: hypothetical protein U9N09_03890, partial [Euryarchaeota archaeon]|nr:hypothetical protein [Euryarchaeota archaeon]